jgi:hypothetical protein
MTDANFMLEALQKIERFRNDPIIMDFCVGEANRKVAIEMGRKLGRTYTVEDLMIATAIEENLEIRARIEQYTDAALVGCLIA